VVVCFHPYLYSFGFTGHTLSPTTSIITACFQYLLPQFIYKLRFYRCRPEKQISLAVQAYDTPATRHLFVAGKALIDLSNARDWTFDYLIAFLNKQGP
jgi:hypothetical protein